MQIISKTFFCDFLPSIFFFSSRIVAPRYEGGTAEQNQLEQRKPSDDRTTADALRSTQGVLPRPHGVPGGADYTRRNRAGSL